jgi:hypothetical protein
MEEKYKRFEFTVLNNYELHAELSVCVKFIHFSPENNINDTSYFLAIGEVFYYVDIQTLLRIL